MMNASQCFLCDHARSEEDIVPCEAPEPRISVVPPRHHRCTRLGVVTPFVNRLAGIVSATGLRKQVVSIGSETLTKTIGIVRLSRCKAAAMGVEYAKITSGCKVVSSFAIGPY